MLIEQIDGLDPESLERGLGDPLDLLWTTVQANPRTRPLVGIVFEPELGGDRHLTAERLKRLAHKVFVGERSVHFGRIEEGDATVNRGVQERDHLLPGTDRAVAEAHSHAAEPESRNFQVAVSKFAQLHFRNSFF